MASPHALVINALNDAIRASIAKSTKDLLDAISKDYGIDLEELRAKYLADAESAATTTTTKKTTKEKPEKIACAATTKKNKPCRRFSVDGSCYCKLHVRFIAETASPETQKTKTADAKKTKKKTMNDLVSPDNFKLRKEFDAVFEEIFEEETEDEEVERSETVEERAAASERSETVEERAAASEPGMDFDDEATEVADDEATEVADDEVADDEVADDEVADDEVADDEVAEEVEVAEKVEEIMVKFWKDATAKRPSMRRTLVFDDDAPATFDRVLDRLSTDKEAADFMDRGFAILSGKNDEVVRDLGEIVRDGVINVLARDDDNFADIEWRHLDDMPDLEAFLERALLSSEIEEEEI